MIVTYFIGNGFDLALGLSTRYSDFYKYCEEQKLSGLKDNYQIAYDKVFFKNSGHLIDGIIFDPKRNENWANFEETLCLEYINSIVTKDDEERFLKGYYDFKSKFSTYLKVQSDIILLNPYIKNGNNEILMTTTSSICRFDEYLSPVNKEYLYKFFDGKTFVFNIVSFNYTKTIDYILSDTDKISSIKYPGQFYEKGKVIDVHGTYENSLIMGFGEQNKIKNKKILENEEIRDAIIKTEHNKTIGKRIDEEVTKLISDSDIIVIFGMSLGQSDSNWWKKIINSSKDKNMPILYFCYHNIKPIENSKYGSEIRKIKDRLAKIVDADENTKEFINKMFIVDMEKRIFDYPNITNKTL